MNDSQFKTDLGARVGPPPIELKVEYSKLNAFFADYAKNICRGRTVIKTSKPVPLGTRFLFRLSIPGRAQPFSLLGEVAALTPQEDVTAMDIRFLFQNDSEKKTFEDEVETRMVNHLGRTLAHKLLQGD